jgi:putative ABC transport system permease protein
MQVSWKENLNIAISAVSAHRFRSGLTMLGIVIGITTVVTVSSLLSGLRQGVVTFFQELGPDNIFIAKISGDPGNPRPPAKEERRRPITPEYVDFLKTASTNLEDVGAQIFILPFAIGRDLTARVKGFEAENVNLNGSSHNLFSISPRNLQQGRFFTEQEAARGARVAMLGASVAEALFPDGNAAGQTFMLDGAEYVVGGVYEKAKGGFFGENGLDSQITIPLKTAQLRYSKVDRYMLIAKAKPGLRQPAYEEVEGLLRKIRRVPSDQPNDFNLSTPDQIVQQFDQITGVIVLVSIAISGLGLLVGGIGVMNIMLVSVTERTREIGVRKAIGARGSDITWQFLMEAVTLTGVGGLMGISFSILVTLLIGALVPSLPSSVPAWAVVAGFSVSVAVGVFFGVWPAVKAAQLDPVEALRYE